MKNLIKICLICAVGSLFFGGCAGQTKVVSKRDLKFSSSLNEIKVMTFNLRADSLLDGWNRWANREKIAFDVLADYAADIIGLQEIKCNQIQKIQKTFPQYDYYAIGRVNGKKRGEACPIFYRKDRFGLIDSGTFWFSKNISKPGSKYFGTVFPRICSWVYLAEKYTNLRFYVYNVHLDAFSQGARKKSARILSKQIACRKTQELAIVMGDFNMKLDNPAMKYLRSKISYRDSWESVHPDKTSSIGTRHRFTGRTSCPKIDHILISGNAYASESKIDRTKVNGKYPSDHFPVISTIVLRKSSSVFSKTQNKKRVIKIY